MRDDFVFYVKHVSFAISPARLHFNNVTFVLKNKIAQQAMSCSQSTKLKVGTLYTGCEDAGMHGIRPK